MTTSTHDLSADNTVVVVGAGPTGLWLASELALAGVHVVVLEKRLERSPHARALGIMPRTLEVLALRGAASPFLAAGRPVPAWHFGLLEQSVRFDTLDTPFPFMLLLPQTTTESLLEERARGLGVVIVTGAELTGLDQPGLDEPGLDQPGLDRPGAIVTATYTENGAERRIEAALVVGCDGAHSAVRRLADIPFVGEASSTWGFVGDVMLDTPPAPGTRIVRPDGALIVAPLPDGRHRLTGWDPEHQSEGEELDLETLRAFTRRMADTDFGLRDPSWLSRFGDANRLAATFRQGRVLLAGDAAHIHWPTGGLGLNAGIHDAMSLGWRAAAFVRGRGTAALLDDYASERRASGEALRTSTLAQGALITAADPAGLALRATMNRLLATAEGNESIGTWLAGLSRESTLPVGVEGLPEAFTGGRPVLVISDATLYATVREALEIASDDIVMLFAEPRREHPLPRAMLVRPDGHLSWASPNDGPLAAGLNDALSRVGIPLGEPSGPEAFDRVGRRAGA
ncbi:FAD-dependent monooxygenase [Subtercola sp. Z020]|uniref:FAD-dependent monooxygenase n=1 Tax=Subtercola sp. Z020 TaxID=2080582 RepID=UPI00130D6ACA|nr:FAD-dependent monooxygenase [Subtercola sp. Z020]